MPVPKGVRPGGRQKGTPNKATADVKAVAQTYTTQAVAVLASIMRSDEQPAAARVSAAKELLDRGHGRPTQTIEHSGGLRTERDLTDAELLAIASGTGAVGAEEGEGGSSSVH